MARTLVVSHDYGHGSGSTHNRGYKGPKWKNEGDANFYFGEMLTKELRKYDGVTVITPRARIGDNPTWKARGNSGQGADLFLSSHTNAAGVNATGTEIFVDVGKGNAPTELANKLCKAISGELGIPNRGVKRRYYNGGNYYAVLRHNLAKEGMLIEYCFHTNYKEIVNYENKANELAKLVAKTIAEHYGLVKLSNNVIEENGDDFLNKLNVDYIISCADTKKYEKEIDKVIKYFTLSNLNYVVTKINNNTNYNVKLPIVAVGGERNNHTSYATYFLPDMKAVNEFYATKNNWNKYKL